MSTSLDPMKRAFEAVMRMAVPVANAIWSVVRVPVLFVLQVAAALILIFEEWGWKPLSEALARLARFKPIARVEQWIASLRPYPSLLVFALPTTVLLPLKFLSVWLLANGYFLSAGALFLGAKVASTALIARIFILTKPALMQIGWFARAYNLLMPWKDAIFARIRASFAWRYGRMLKNAVRLETKQAYARWKPWIARQWQQFAPQLSEFARTVPNRVRVWWRVTKPKLSAAIASAKTSLKQAYDRLIGIS